MAMTVPVVLGVMVALQLDVVVLTLARVHGVPVNDPVAVPPFVNATVPPGEDAVPVEMSLTKAVHVTICPTATDTGVHVATVDVARRPTVTVLLAVGPLPL
ncbi:MAG TPA: hypothetical protein VK667_05060 [Ktedonobacteraceae bacterium]|nr:hypothetical protein [Ktedonobacteraceae bacterium]